ncbi:hypothetical protein HMPREF1357_00031 [Enterococcus faecium C497]|nr:hypothetical protein HMPREF1357_00031 [Enterococcus faecium C497]EJY25537.1 hypothetical protein HMPREF1356_00124 [Enterococcus faecium C1904]
MQRSLRSLAKGKIKTVVQRRIGLGLERHIRLSKTFLVVLGNLLFIKRLSDGQGKP